MIGIVRAIFAPLGFFFSWFHFRSPLKEQCTLYLMKKLVKVEMLHRTVICGGLIENIVF